MDWFLDERMKAKDIIKTLRSMANPDNAAGMARYGISVKGALGVPMPALRKLGRENGRDHETALALWASGIHEARILAALVDEPEKVTDAQMESWALDLVSWDVCDQVCSNLFDRTAAAYAKAKAWSRRPETFVKRAGFVLMAALSVHDKKRPDRDCAAFFPLIQKQAADDRNFVKKAVNWALRQIGKRNRALNAAAIEAAEAIQRMDAPSARWIAAR